MPEGITFIQALAIDYARDIARIIILNLNYKYNIQTPEYQSTGVFTFCLYMCGVFGMRDETNC